MLSANSEHRQILRFWPLPESACPLHLTQWHPSFSESQEFFPQLSQSRRMQLGTLYDQDIDELITLSEHFATTTSAHGLGRVVNESSTKRRCFYLVAFLGSLAAFIWFTLEFLKTYYYSYGTTSTVIVLTNYSIVAPRMTICSTSYMRCDCALFYDPLYAVKYKLNQYQCGTKPTNAMESFTFRDDPCGSMYPGGATEASAALISELTATGKLSETSLLEYARHKFVPSSSKNTTASSLSLLNVPEVMVECLYMGKSCLDSQQWHEFMDYRYGVCSTFVVGNQDVMMRGRKGGIYMVLRAHTNTNYEKSGLINELTGFHLFIESPHEPMSLMNPVSISVGMQTDIGLDLTHIDDTSIYQNGNGLYSKCSISNESSLNSCVASCFIDQIQSECGCIPLVASPMNTHGDYSFKSSNPVDQSVDQSSRTCSMHGDLGFQNNDCAIPGTFKEECCAIDSERALEKSISTKERDGSDGDSPSPSNSTVCLENCQAPCDRLIFKTSARASTWPSTRYVKKLAIQYEGDMNGDDSSTVSSLKDTLRSEVSAVSIYLNSMDILHVETGVAFGVSSLFGSIGGTLGLFIGFSIITVVELIDFIMVFFWLCGKRTASTASKLEKASEEKIRQHVQTNISKTKIGISVVHPKGQGREQEQEQELSATELMSWTKKKKKSTATTITATTTTHSERDHKG